MKRVKRVFTHQRHWLWHLFSMLVTGAGSAQYLFDPKTDPRPYLLMVGFSLVGGFVAWYCKPQDDGDA